MLSKIGPEKEQFIEAVAQKVKSHGIKFEEVLRDRENQNPKFEFLRNMDVSDFCASIATQLLSFADNSVIIV